MAPDSERNGDEEVLYLLCKARALTPNPEGAIPRALRLLCRAVELLRRRVMELEGRERRLVGEEDGCEVVCLDCKHVQFSPRVSPQCYAPQLAGHLSTDPITGAKAPPDPRLCQDVNYDGTCPHFEARGPMSWLNRTDT